MPKAYTPYTKVTKPPEYNIPTSELSDTIINNYSGAYDFTTNGQMAGTYNRTIELLPGQLKGFIITYNIDFAGGGASAAIFRATISHLGNTIQLIFKYLYSTTIQHTENSFFVPLEFIQSGAKLDLYLQIVGANLDTCFFSVQPIILTNKNFLVN